jgi:excisionase family DNA binding protein
MTSLLTARQVADRLGVSAETVLRWTRRGDLPGFRLPGGALRFREDELDIWLVTRSTTPPRHTIAPTTEAAPAGRDNAKPGPNHGGLISHGSLKR